MIKIIVGNKGSGKTKRLIDSINARAEESNGNVVCIEKGMKLTYDITHRARLIDGEHYGISNYDELYSFISGVLAGDHDITDVFVDGTLKMGGKDYESLVHFLDRLSARCGRRKRQYAADHFLRRGRPSRGNPPRCRDHLIKAVLI